MQKGSANFGFFFIRENKSQFNFNNFLTKYQWVMSVWSLVFSLI